MPRPAWSHLSPTVIRWAAYTSSRDPSGARKHINMPEFVMRDAPDGETYILWDTRTDGCNGYGTRSELRTYLVKNYSMMFAPDQAVTHVDTMLTYIDETGTSARTLIGSILTGSWEDLHLECKELELVQGWLARDRLIDYARARVAGDLDTAASLLEPFEA